MKMMAWMSEQAVRLDGRTILKHLVADDVPIDLARVVRRGWVIHSGAHVLTPWLESYHGRREAFPTVRAYEAAVNGRAIPDLDLMKVGGDVRQPLLRRGLAFAWVALRRQAQDLPDVTMTGEVSISPMLFDPDEWTGSVTFYTGANVDAQAVDGEVVIRLQTDDCSAPLPATSKWSSIVRRVRGAHLA